MHADDILHLKHDAIVEADTKGVRPLPIALVVLIGIIAIAWWALSGGPLRKSVDAWGQSAVDDYSITVRADVPVVEPLELQKVPEDVARKINAATPFTSEPVPPARPFRITGTPVDIARATDCLAAAIWYEAGAETLAGKKAVAQVVLNRVRHPAFPKTVCGVVFQGSERITGCQFTFSCDGAMARIPSAGAWTNMRGLARIMLNGEVFKPVGTATHYHTDWVLPAWSSKLDKVHKEATHLFFRWAGWWGTPPAFRGRYAGAEPLVRKLAALSPSHAQMLAGDTVLPDSLPVDPSASLPGTTPVDGAETTTAVPPNAYGFTPRLQSPAGDFLVFVVPKSTDPGMMLGLVLSSCSVRPYCKVLVWTDARRAPGKMPVTDEQLASLSFSYLRNRSSGLDKALWNCDLYPRPDSTQCMKPRPVPPAPTKAASTPTPVAAPVPTP